MNDNNTRFRISDLVTKKGSLTTRTLVLASWILLANQKRHPPSIDCHICQVHSGRTTTLLAQSARTLSSVIMLAAAVSFAVGAPPNLHYKVKTALVATDRDPTKKMYAELVDTTLQTSSGSTGDKLNGLHG